MRTPAIILLLFILASFTIIFLSRPIKVRPKTLEERIDRSIPTTKVTWIDTLQNLGKVIEGNSITVQFRFKNSGTRMLVISDVAASCGCTIPEKPEKPISPDSVGVIKAIF